MNPETTQNQGKTRADANAVARDVLQPNPLLDLLAKNDVVMHVPQDCSVAGDLYLNGGLLVTGTVNGNILCRGGTVIVAPAGRVRGRMEAQRVVVLGAVGDPREPVTSRIIAHVKCVIAATADLQAFCICAGIEVQPGARLHESIFEEINPPAASVRPAGAKEHGAANPVNASQPAYA